MKYVEFTGKTVEEAVEKGLQELGLTKETADIRVLEEGKKKLFGSVKARVEIATLCDDTQEEVKAQEPKQEEKKVCQTTCTTTAGKSDGERTVEFLDGLFKLLKITACTELIGEGEKVEINVTAANSTAVIGKHGVMLDAIQTLAGAVANIGREEYKRVVVDCEGYRCSREATLIKLAENLAQKAIRMQRKVKLEPMNPYERRIIHAAISELEGVKTESEGKEPNRYIVVIPDNLEDPTLPAIPARTERNNRQGGGRGGKGGYGGRGGKSGGKGGFGGKSGGQRKFNRNSSATSSSSGGTTLKQSNDFFGIFLGNSGNNSEE